MSVQVTINGVDKTKWIAWESLKIDNILTTQVDKCSFKIRNYGSHIYIPRVGSEVIITDNSVRVFAGFIVRRDNSAEDYKVLNYVCECVDYTRLLQKKMVVENYENMTVTAIIQSMVAKYAPYSINTTTYVDCPKVITYISFNYEPVQQCLQKLADIAGYDWYIDYNKNLWFKSTITNSAPFSLTDTNGNYSFSSLRIRKDNSQVRNTIIVRGGNYYGSKRTDKILCNGTDFAFPLPYKYRDFSASLTGNPLDIGIDFSSDPEQHHALWNYEEKVLRFKNTDIPSVGATLSVSGEPLIPVIVKVKNPTAIAAMFSAEGIAGDYEYAIVDNNLTSKEEARDRANAELLAYAESLEEGEFITETSGLMAGQTISINSDAHGINENFIIRQVTARMFTPNQMNYRVSLISTRTIDMIGILQRLLSNRDTNRSGVGEILDKITSYYEEVTLSESVVASRTHEPQYETLTVDEVMSDKGLDYPLVFVTGAYVPAPQDKTLRQTTGASTGDGYTFACYGSNRACGQNFTPTATEYYGSFKFYAYRVGSPGSMWIALYGTSAGLPTGSALAYFGYNGNSLSTNSASPTEIEGIWIGNTQLTASTTYCVVIYATGGSAGNEFYVRTNSTNVDSNGVHILNNSGWSTQSPKDLIYHHYAFDYKRQFVLNGSRLG